MDERGEVVGFADHVAAGEDGAAANFAQNDDTFFAPASLFGELLANGGGIGAFSFQIEDDDVGMMLAGKREAFVGGFRLENLHPAASENGAQHFSIVG